MTKRYKHIFMSFTPIATSPQLGLSALVSRLRAVSEETRLRIVALLAEGELSVSDLTDILGQSQPRISRHLKILGEAGVVERHREGAWAFFRLAEGVSDAFIQTILATLDLQDPGLSDDRNRLASVRTQRSQAAQAFFARLAPRWDELRSLHVPEGAVEAAILDVLGTGRIGTMVDLGTGTGRMLQVVAPLTERAVGLDASHAMLSVARANLARAGISRVELRQGDIYAPPLAPGSFDLVLIHQVLHYLDDPARALFQAGRLLAPGGRLLVVDFAPHDLEFLREAQAHRRLGFAPEQVSAWLEEAGLVTEMTRELAPSPSLEAGLTVSLWLGRDRRSASGWRAANLTREVA